MNTRDIVRKAWQITQVHLKKLIWYGSVPAFFSIIVSSIYLAYQYNAFKTSVLFSGPGGTDVLGTAKTVWGIISGHPAASTALIIVSIFFFIGYIIIPPIFRGTLINAIHRIKNYEPIHGSVEVGVRHFFPMFEFAILLGAFSITTLFTEASFILRWWGEGVFFVTLPILLFVAMVGLVLSFLFTYAEFYIVLENKGLMRSIMDSSILVISNLRRTFLVFVLIVLISVRIVLNVLLVLLVPMLVIFLSSYFSFILSTVLGLSLVALFGLLVTGVSSYLLGLFYVFTSAVWVLTFDMLVNSAIGEIKDDDLGKEGPDKHVTAESKPPLDANGPAAG